MPTLSALARQIATRVNMRDIMVAPQADFAGDMIQLSATTSAEEKARAIEAKVELVAMYGIDGYVDKPFAFANGIAVIPVHGSLVNRFSQCWGFITGYNFIQKQLRAALDDDDVKGIIFDCNSRGGEVNGLFETADEIFLSRGTKPIIAMVDTDAYSACYAIASSCDRIILTPSGGAGSIGAMCLHISFEEMLTKLGMKVTPIYSGDHKIDGTPYMDLPESVRAEIQKDVDDSRNTFVSLVSRNRNLPEQVIFDTQAACYRATAALELGLIDAVMTPTQAAVNLLNELNGSHDDLEDDEMTPEQIAAAAANPAVVAAVNAKAAAAAEPAAAAPAAAAPAAAAPAAAAPAASAEAGAAERSRCQSILGCDEAKGREATAQHLAFSTEMTVDQAKATLASVPLAAAPAAAAPAAAAADPFKQAMDNGAQPNVGADGASLSGQQAETNPLLRDYAAVHGKPLS